MISVMTEPSRIALARPGENEVARIVGLGAPPGNHPDRAVFLLDDRGPDETLPGVKRGARVNGHLDEMALMEDGPMLERFRTPSIVRRHFRQRYRRHLSDHPDAHRGYLD